MNQSGQNPWLALPSSPPFVLPEDQRGIEAFNRKANADIRLETNLLPEPFVGRLDAPIMLLTLNPGVSAEDFRLHERQSFRERVKRCHRQEKVRHPNYYLDPRVGGPGARWMSRVTKPLIEEFDLATVANAVALLDYFPYHSRRFAHRRLRVSGQDFTFRALRTALARGAAVFVTRGRAIWEDAVPELRDYARAFRTRSTQNVVISPRNSPDGYEAAVAILRDL